MADSPGTLNGGGVQTSTSSSSVVITLIGTAVPAGITMLAYLIVAHELGAEGRGFVAAATAPLLLVTSAFTFGIPESLIFHGARGQVSGSSVVWRALLVLGCAGVGGVLATWLLGGVLSGGDEQLASTMVVVSVFGIPALLVMGLRALALSRQHWRLVAAERLTAALLRVAILFLLATLALLTVSNSSLIIAATMSVGGLLYAADLSEERSPYGRPSTGTGRLPSNTAVRIKNMAGLTCGYSAHASGPTSAHATGRTSGIGLLRRCGKHRRDIARVNAAVREVIFSRQAASLMTRLSLGPLAPHS